MITLRVAMILTALVNRVSVKLRIAIITKVFDFLWTVVSSQRIFVTFKVIEWMRLSIILLIFEERRLRCAIRNNNISLQCLKWNCLRIVFWVRLIRIAFAIIVLVFSCDIRSEMLLALVKIHVKLLFAIISWFVSVDRSLSIESIQIVATDKLYDWEHSHAKGALHLRWMKTTSISCCCDLSSVSRDFINYIFQLFFADFFFSRSIFQSKCKSFISSHIILKLRA